MKKYPIITPKRKLAKQLCKLLGWNKEKDWWSICHLALSREQLEKLIQHISKNSLRPPD